MSIPPQVSIVIAIYVILAMAKDEMESCLFY